MGHLQHANEVLTDVVKEHRRSLSSLGLLPTTLVDIALCQALHGAITEAESLLADAVPNKGGVARPSLPAMRAFVQSGQRAEDAKDDVNASYFYRAAVNFFPGNSEVTPAQFYIAWQAHEAKNLNESSRLLTEHIAVYAGNNSDFRGKAAYWAARDSERVGRLLNDLLGLARLEAHPTRIPVDLAAIARPLVADAQARAPHATITLSADNNIAVGGDPDALERVFRNLIDNALAAIQPTGRIDVQLRRRNGCTEALVADDGPGVPEHERQRIFERFVRLDPSKPGHGLGLAIARRIAQQHDGDLTCDPRPSGASFTLRLPTEP
jgi:signal transduction histidine kinase